MFLISKRVSFLNWNTKSNVGVQILNATLKKYLFRTLKKSNEGIDILIPERR